MDWIKLLLSTLNVLAREARNIYSRTSVPEHIRKAINGEWKGRGEQLIGPLGRAEFDVITLTLNCGRKAITGRGLVRFRFANGTSDERWYTYTGRVLIGPNVFVMLDYAMEVNPFDRIGTVLLKFDKSNVLDGKLIGYGYVSKDIATASVTIEKPILA
jgi:hypothetical protein